MINSKLNTLIYVNYEYCMNIDFCFRFRKRDLERLLSLTDSFTWEELPSRDPATGYLTKAAYIPIAQSIATYVPTLVYAFHIAQTTVRIVTSRDMVFPAWLPFDASVSPVYEIATIVQVFRNVLTNFLLIQKAAP
jgi:hypothetical protein